VRDGQGYEILRNGVPRTFRDRRETALEAARFAKSNAKGDIIELRDCATGETCDAGGWQGGLEHRRFLAGAHRYGIR
jgi:hypothetical protein